MRTESRKGSILLSETFSGIQGEGLYVGYRQLFVRLAGCNLSCDYCDTQEVIDLPKNARCEKTPGNRDFFYTPRSISVEWLIDHINQQLLSPYHSVSFTGGEPLCQSEALRQVATQIAKPVYLETNGSLSSALQHVIDVVDIIAMDIKLPSASGHQLWNEHRNFLRIASQKDVFVKIVFCLQTTKDEIDKSIDIISSIDVNIPLVLQPVSPSERSASPTPEQVLAFQDHAMRSLRHVRVIPQTHKMIGQL